MIESIKSHLMHLCMLPGISGYEDAVRNYIREYAAPFADEIQEDATGNLLLLRRGTGNAKRVMLCAHMDETGFLITHIGADGMLKFVPIGNFSQRIVPGLSVRVGDAQVPGSIGLKPIHLTPKKERDLTVPMDALRIDLGARSREEAEKYTFPGDFAAFDSKIRDYGEDGLTAKALDSRIGCLVLLEQIKKQQYCDVWYVFSVQRQIGSNIASVIHRLAPDFALVFDAIEDGGLPGSTQPPPCLAGRGVVLPLINGNSCAPSPYLDAVQQTATSCGIPLQVVAQADGGDTERISAAAQGVATLSLRTAVRYSRCPYSSVKFSDVRDLLQLTNSLFSHQIF